MSNKPLPKWAKITIIVVCSLVVVAGAGIGFFHLWLSLQEPAHGPNYVEMSELTEARGGSIASEGLDLLYLSNHVETIWYSKYNEVVLIEESYHVNGIDVVMLVNLSCELEFEKEWDLHALTGIMSKYNIGETSVSIKPCKDKTVAFFYYNGKSYSVVMNTTDLSSATEILDSFFNG